MVVDNLPELSTEEKVLINMSTMEIPKEKSNKYLVEGKQSQFKLLEAEKKLA